MKHICFFKDWIGVFLAIMFISLFLLQPNSMNAQSSRQVTLRITVERVRALECFDEVIDIIITICESDPDFYAIVNIGDEAFPSTSKIDDTADISPNWEFSRLVDLNSGSITARIDILDSDNAFWPFSNEDDHADLDPGTDLPLNLTINLSDCLAKNFGAISGDIGRKNCSETIVSEGDGSDSAQIFFRVVIEPPPSAPGTNVRCLHDPIWPQANDTVTITAEALDGALASKFFNIEIEIWYNNNSQPFAVSPLNQSSFITTTGPVANGDVPAYGCLVRDKTTGEEVWTGWRRVQVGTPASGRAVPILQTGSMASRIDIVFLADIPDATPGSGYANGANDAAFRTAVHNVIRDAYYNKTTTNVDIFLKNQDKFNFWVAQDSGDGDGPPNGNDVCTQLDPPANWNSDYTFADTGAIVHPQFYRDCAIPAIRILSSAPTSPRTFLHETGHSPFGLADEYGNNRPANSYFQPSPHPNMYIDQTACQSDPLALDIIDSCQPVTTTVGLARFRVDPLSTVTNDLMVNNETPQGADVRRMNWFFDTCRGGECSRPTAAVAASLQLIDPRTQPIPELDLGQNSKVMVVTVSYDQSGKATVVSSEIVNGVPPARFADPHMQKVKVLDGQQNIVEEFGAWDPLLESSETIRADSTRYVFPFKPELKTLDIVNPTDAVQNVTADLKPAINQFCDVNATESACATDLALSIESPLQAIAGAKLTYTLQIENLSVVAASQVLLSQTLPPSVIFDADRSSPNCTEGEGVVTCKFEQVSESSSLSVPIIVTVDPAAPSRSIINLSSSLSGKQTDPNTANNSATRQIEIIRRADLVISDFTIVNPPTTLYVGEETTIILAATARNDGPSSPVNAVLNGTTTAQSDSIAVANPPTINLPDLAAPRAVQQTYTVNCGEVSDHTFTFTADIQPVNPDDVDLNLANNRATASLNVECIFKLDLSTIGWHLVSMPVIPLDAQINKLLNEIVGQYTKVLSFEVGGLAYVPTLPNFSTLATMDGTHGYWLYMQQGGIVNVRGQPQPKDTPIPLEKGWNLVSYLPQASLPVAQALASIAGKYDKVLGFDRGATSYYAALQPPLNTLQEMKRGQGYWIHMTEAGVLNYALASSLVEGASTDLANQPQALDAMAATSQWINVYSTNSIRNGEPLPVGTTVTAIGEDGRMLGRVMVRAAGWYGVLAVYGADDSNSGFRGARVGEEIRFLINGEPAMIVNGPTPVWTSSGDLFQVDLAIDGQRDVHHLFLPNVQR